MAIWIKTKYPGVRYREHESRRAGVAKDRYYTIRYKLNGKDKEEGLGWTTSGWTAEKAAARLGELKEAQRTGKGHVTLKDSREEAAANRKAKTLQKEKEAKESVCLKDFYEQFYEKHLKTRRTQHSFDSEKGQYKKWLEKDIGDKRIKDINVQDVEAIKQKMLDDGKALRTIESVMKILNQIFSYAKILGFITCDCPTTKLPPLKFDNKRERYLTKDEANSLMEALQKRSPQLYVISMVSLYCGLRAGEVHKLTYGDLDFDNETISIRNTKSKRNRQAYMTRDIKKLLKTLPKGEKSELLFKTIKGEQITEVSNTFADVVTKLGFNDGVTDATQKVVFHTLRHTFASWLVIKGRSLYDVQKLLGHSNLAMTERYAHLAPGHLKETIKALEEDETAPKVTKKKAKKRKRKNADNK